MIILLGLLITLGSILGGFVLMGGRLAVLAQPWEYTILLGAAFGTFVISNSVAVIKDTAKASLEAIKEDRPKEKDYLDLLSLLYSLMRKMRSKTYAEMEEHFDSPETSSLFAPYPSILKHAKLTHFIADYARLIKMGSATVFEIESLMDEELETVSNTMLKAAYALEKVSEAFPALGIVAAILGVIKAMGALSESPERLGMLIGGALTGTFSGVFFSYGIFGPLATKIKSVRQEKGRLFTIVKQTLLAYMNGALPQVALEYGCKVIPYAQRPTVEKIEEALLQHQDPNERAV